MARGRLLSALARWLDVSGRPRSSRYVMVLPGDENTRPYVAAALVNAGLAQQVLVPEPRPSPAGTETGIPPADELICRVLEARGVPDDRITLLPRRGGGTYGDVQALAGFLDSSRETSVTIVTSWYHTRRTRSTVRCLLGQRAREVSLVSAPTEDFSVDNWWQSKNGLINIAGEYAKMGYYVMRYTQLPYWLVLCALLAGALLICRRLRAEKAGRHGRPA